jgi:hypothetical protein
MVESDESMVPPLMGFTIKVQGSECYHLNLFHRIKLEVHI